MDVARSVTVARFAVNAGRDLVIGAHFAEPTAGHIRTHREGDVRFDGLGL